MTLSMEGQRASDTRVLFLMGKNIEMIILSKCDVFGQ